MWALDEINFPEYIQTELRLQGITRPSAIQSMAWPSIFSGRDIMCIGLPTASRVLSVSDEASFRGVKLDIEIVR